MDTHTDVPYFLHLQKQDKKIVFLNNNYVHVLYKETCRVSGGVCSSSPTCLVVFVCLFVFIFYIFFAVFVLSSLLLHAHAMFYLINQVWLFSRVEFAA